MNIIDGVTLIEAGARRGIKRTLESVADIGRIWRLIVDVARASALEEHA